MTSNRSSSSGVNSPNQNIENITGNSISTTITKALASQSSWPDKEEFLDVIYWMRQIVGVLLGLAWGVIAIQVIILTMLLLKSRKTHNYRRGKVRKLAIIDIYSYRALLASFSLEQ